MNDQDFFEELTQMVIRRAESSHLVDTLGFVYEVADRLADDPIFGDYNSVEYSGNGFRKRKLKVHGFTSLDESDGTLGLVIAHWESNPGTLTTAQIHSYFSLLENFLSECLYYDLKSRITEASPAFELASIVQQNHSNLTRIRLHFFSNSTASLKLSYEQLSYLDGIQIEKNIWDFRRIKALFESSREREAIELDLKDFDHPGIPCLQATSDSKLASYLCVVEGNLLADIFERYGSRLLEGNVRSFLGMKGGVNKGIKNTIQACPSLLFAFNNGISATASSLKIQTVSGQARITNITDLQIVNGGQTTASILSARKKDKFSLDNVAVQMKLTRVDLQEGDELIPKIAQFANTQNKISVTDFFANHPFHRKMEELSRRLQVSASQNSRIQSKWFYERSRGQFQNERLYLSKAQKTAHDAEFPPNQVINKTSLAKYDSTDREKPYWVSLGAQKNFTKFAAQFNPSKSETSEGEYWTTLAPKYSDEYYRKIITIAILWTHTEGVISKGRGSWYLGDYRQQIAAYSTSLLLHIIRKQNCEFNFDKLWKLQKTDDILDQFIETIARQAQNQILNPPPGSTNVGEWCKKEQCWSRMQGTPISIPNQMSAWIINLDENSPPLGTFKNGSELDKSPSAQSEALKLMHQGYWLKLSRDPDVKNFLSPSDYDLVAKASSALGYARINSERSWSRLIAIRDIVVGKGM